MSKLNMEEFTSMQQELIQTKSHLVEIVDEIQVYEEKIKRKDAQNKQLLIETKNLLSENEDQTEEIAKLRATVDDLQRQVDGERDKSISFQRTTNEYRQDQSEYEERILDLNRSHHDIKVYSQKLEEDIERYKEKLSIYEDEIVDVTNQRSVLMQELEKTQNDLEKLKTAKTFGEADGQLDLAQKESLAKINANLKKELDTLRDRGNPETYEITIEEQKNTIETQDQKLKEQRTTIATYSSELSTLKLKYEETLRSQQNLLQQSVNERFPISSPQIVDSSQPIFDPQEQGEDHPASSLTINTSKPPSSPIPRGGKTSTPNGNSPTRMQAEFDKERLHYEERIHRLEVELNEVNIALEQEKLQKEDVPDSPNSVMSITRMKTLKDKIDLMTKKLNERDTTIEELKNQITLISAQPPSSRSPVMVLPTTTSNVPSELDKTIKENLVLSNSLAEAKLGNEKLQRQLRELLRLYESSNQSTPKSPSSFTKEDYSAIMESLKEGKLLYEQQVKTLNERMNRANRQLDSKTKRIKKLSEQLEEKDKKQRALTHQVEVLQTQLNSSSDVYKSSAALHQQQQENVKEQVDELQDQCDQLRNERDHLSTNLSHIRTDFDNLKDKYLTIQEIAASKSELADRRLAEIETLRLQLDQFENDKSIEALSSSDAEQTANSMLIDNLQSENAQLRAEQQQLKDRIVDHDTNDHYQSIIDSLNEELKQLREDQELLSDELDAKKDEYVILKEKYETVLSKMERQQGDILEFESTKGTIDNTLKLFKERLASLEQQHHDKEQHYLKKLETQREDYDLLLSKERSEHSFTVRSLRKELDDLAQQHQSATSSHFEDQLDRANHIISAQHQAVKDIKSEMLSTKDGLQQLQLGLHHMLSALTLQEEKVIKPLSRNQNANTSILAGYMRDVMDKLTSVANTMDCKAQLLDARLQLRLSSEYNRKLSSKINDHASNSETNLESMSKLSRTIDETQQKLKSIRHAKAKLEHELSQSPLKS